MSKKINDNSNIPASDSFSFLELNQYLSQGNVIKENKANKEKKTKKKSLEKKESEKKQKLKIEPNANIAREQTNDDLMYIEKEDNLEKKVEEKKEVEKEEKKEPNINKEKNIPKKNEKKKFNDKKIVKINFEKLEGQNLNKDPNKKDTDNTIQNDGCDIEEIINDIKEKDPQAYTPIVLPFEKNADDEGKSLKDNLIEKDDNDQNRLFVFQFPRQIPIKNLKIQEQIKEEENVNNKPNFDQDGVLIYPEFKNSFSDIEDNTVIGKLVFMKSGKVKIKMGDTYFDINQGSKTKFAQYSAIVNVKEDNKAYILGQPFYRKLIVTPEID